MEIDSLNERQEGQVSTICCPRPNLISVTQDVRRCLLVADDLTGAADAGAQFAKIGLNTLLISMKEDRRVNLAEYADRDVLVVNTDSRGSSPERAFRLVSDLLKAYDRELYPVIYKKIDSTLRGNIGREIDAILLETSSQLCFFAPSYPE